MKNICIALIMTAGLIGPAYGAERFFPNYPTEAEMLSAPSWDGDFWIPGEGPWSATATFSNPPGIRVEYSRSTSWGLEKHVFYWVDADSDVISIEDILGVTYDDSSEFVDFPRFPTPGHPYASFTTKRFTGSGFVEKDYIFYFPEYDCDICGAPKTVPGLGSVSLVVALGIAAFYHIRHTRY